MKIPSSYILDSYQQKVFQALETLSNQLTSAEHPSFLSKVAGCLKKPSASQIKGLYIYGSVGRGKTMLMDAFYDSLAVEKKQRWHFHAFMQQQVHQRLKEMGQMDEVPIEVLAREIAGGAHVLCFDEFHVSDIADAMILGRLFGRLFELGTVVVATSNQRPDNLYEGGLHRDRFLPFIEVLKARCDEIELNGPTDYRRAILNKHKRYFFPINVYSLREMDEIFQELSDGRAPQCANLNVNGRELDIPLAANGVVRMSFHDLCEVPLGAADYLALANNFHTLLLESVPVMNKDMHNEAKRFITLVDILYDQEVNLVLTAEAEPDCLYEVGQNSDFFKRTASRLIEMTGF